MAQPKEPRPVRLTISVDLPRPLVDRFKAQARRRKVDLETIITEALTGAGPAPAASADGACRHTRLVADPKVPGIRECVDCKTRIV